MTTAGEPDERGTPLGETAPTAGGSSGSPGGFPAQAGKPPLADLLDHLIRDVPDFPEPGVLFKDITPLLADHAGFAAVVEALAEPFRGRVDVVLGMEARGFIFAAPVALALGVGFVPVRKPGKLPHETTSVSYDLEYGSAELQMHTDALRPGQRVLVVDDVLATGGTARAAADLVEGAGAVVAAVAVVLELSFLPGREAVGDLPVHTLRTV